MNNLSLDDMEVFLTVVEVGSFNRAGARLHLGQASVSERMSRLERRLGEALFTRTSRGVELTAAGRLFRPHAQRCTRAAIDAQKALAANDADEPFHIVTHATFAALTISLVVEALSHLSLELTNNDAHSEEVVRQVADGEADIGFAVPVPAPPSLTLSPFYDDPVICVSHPDHALAGQARVTIKDLAGHLVAVNPWGDRSEQFIDALRSAAIPSSALRLVSPAETVAALARTRAHIGLLTRSTVAWELVEGSLVALSVEDLPRWSVQVQLVYRTADAEREPVAAVLKLTDRLLGSTSGGGS